jgi:hypothetical protein
MRELAFSGPGNALTAMAPAEMAALFCTNSLLFMTGLIYC